MYGRVQQHRHSLATARRWKMCLNCLWTHGCAGAEQIQLLQSRRTGIFPHTAATPLFMKLHGGWIIYCTVCTVEMLYKRSHIFVLNISKWCLQLQKKSTSALWTQTSVLWLFRVLSTWSSWETCIQDFLFFFIKKKNSLLTVYWNWSCRCISPSTKVLCVCCVDVRLLRL